MSLNIQAFRGETCKEYRFSHSTQGSKSSWEATIHSDFVSKFTVLCSQAYSIISSHISATLHIHCTNSSNYPYVQGTRYIKGQSFSTVYSTPPTSLEREQFLARNQNFFFPRLWKVVVLSPLKNMGRCGGVLFLLSGSLRRWSCPARPQLPPDIKATRENPAG